jgi:hypothetical protein
MTRMTYLVPSSSVRIERDSGVVTRRYLVQHFFASSTNSLAGETRVGTLCVLELFSILLGTTSSSLRRGTKGPFVVYVAVSPPRNNFRTSSSSHARSGVSPDADWARASAPRERRKRTTSACSPRAAR